MPLFSSSSPFDADVERATNEKNTDEDWGLIMDICDKVGRENHGAHDCLKSIIKRMNHKVPFVVLQALTLLDACVKNCGRVFHLEVCTREFMGECRTLLTQKTHPKVVQKLRFYIKKWSEMPEIKADKSLSLITAVYQSLKREGADFSDPDAVPAGPGNAAADSAREQQEMSRAIALSLEQAEREGQAKAPAVHYPSNPDWASNYPDLSSVMDARVQDMNKHVRFDEVTGGSRKVLYSVRALYDFEAVEDNELTFKAGELINVTDDSDSNWWRGFNSRGDGLFPTNFVTTDLSVEPNHSDSKLSANQEIEADSDLSANQEEGTTVDHNQHDQIEINESQIDEALATIQNADPTGESKPDTPEMLRLEAQCKAMGPMIDSELEKVDKDITQLVDLNLKVREALQMYYTLMRENPNYCATRLPPGPLPSGPYPSPVGQPPRDTTSPQMGQPAVYGGQQMYYGGPGVPPMTVPPAGPPPSSQPPPSPLVPSPPPANQDPGLSDPAGTTTTPTLVPTTETSPNNTP